jgi:DNA transposition AAA+ family ATPase
MNISPGKLEFTEEEHAQLRVDVRAVIEAGTAQAEVARQADVPSSTLSQYLNGKYSAEPGKTETAVRLHKWLRSLETAAEVRNRLPVAPTYQPLKAANSIRAQLTFARLTGRMVLIGGAPGVGKTATARQFQSDNPHVWYAAMNPTTERPSTMLRAFLTAMGVAGVKGSPQLMHEQVCFGAKGKSGLLIVDEAQHLSEAAIDALRSVNDEIRVGIAVMGNEVIHSKVGATGVKPAFAQVSSRFSRRSWYQAPDPQDVADLANAWAASNIEILGPDEIRFCQEIAARPGGLRNIEMTMEAAIMIARGVEQPLEISHLRGAFSQLSGVR